MKASWEKLEKNEGILSVEVPEDIVAAGLDKAFKKVVGKVNVPGFRKGKVPRQIFEAKFGVEALYQDAIDFVLQDAYRDALKETGIEPIDRPEIDIQHFEKGDAFTFTAKVQVKPEAELGEYKGLEVPEKDFSVSADDVQAELDSMQQRHAELVVIDEGAAEDGDSVVLDFDGYVDGEAFEGGKAERHTLELGSNSFIPGFEEQVVGMLKEEDKDIEVVFPEDYHAEHLAGKTAVFKVKIHEIKRKVLPELDDEFAKDVSEFETLDEYRADIEKTINERKQKEREHYIEDTVIEKAAANATVDVPEAMIRNEVDYMYSDFTNRLRMQGMNAEMYFQYTGQNEEVLKEQMKGDAQKRVLHNLVLEAIAKAENISATEEEMNEELEKLAEQYKQPVEELKKAFESNDTLDSIESNIVTRKTIKFLVDESKSTTDVA